MVCLDEEAVKQEYVKETIVFEGETIEDVEVQYKRTEDVFSFPANRVCLDCDIDVVQDATETVFGKKYATSSL